jgi:hypothetical protein
MTVPVPVPVPVPVFVSVSVSVCIYSVRVCVWPLQLEMVSRHRKHVRTFGAFSAWNATQESRDSALRLQRLYKELLFWEPARKASLHNYGVFLEDIMRDRESAEWLYQYGGIELDERCEYEDQADDSSENFEKDLEHIPEALHNEARMDPSQICWPWNDPVKDAPSGKYRKQHVCFDAEGSCPIPADNNPDVDRWRARGCFQGPPLPQLPGEQH